MFKKVVVILLLVLCVSAYISISMLKKSRPDTSLRTFADLQDRELVKIAIVSQNDSEQNSASENTNILPIKQFSVEVVNTTASTTLGLSGRDQIGSDGMLFIFPETRSLFFWMKDMRFDLDMVWIADNKIIEISKNVPKPEENTPDFKLQTYSSQEPANMVLELPAGESEKHNINPGDLVQLVQ